MACLLFQQKRRIEVQTLYNAGITNARDISLRSLIPERTVYRIINSIKNNKGLEHKSGAGRPSKIHPNDKRRISNILKSTPRISIRRLTSRLEANVGKSSTHRYLKRENFVKSPVIRVPALTDFHVQKRINWCKEMKEFDWSKTFFTDECSIWLDSGKIKVWTKRVQRVNLPSYRHPSKVHVGVGFL